MINKNIFRAYDIRGIAHKPGKAGVEPELTPETMGLIGKGAGTYLKRKAEIKSHAEVKSARAREKIIPLRIAVGYDCRLSNPELARAFIKGLVGVGCDVTVLGMIPTPMLYFAVCKLGFDGGASITASHNPKEYNGVKLVSKNSHSICGEELQEILKIIEEKDFEQCENLSKKKQKRDEKETRKMGDRTQSRIENLNIFPTYLEKLLSTVKLKRPLKIVVDSGNGATGPYVKKVFESLGCTVTPLFTKPDGRYSNHEANPEEVENMQDLIKAVKKNKADLGLGFDGDGDRVGVVDEKGQHYQADLLLLILARDLLKKQPGSKIVFDVKVSQILIEDIQKHGGVPVMTKTGHSFIEKRMRELGAPLGGEISGHLFFADNYYGFDDAFLGAARLLQVLSESTQPFSALFKNIPKTAITPEFKSPCPDEQKFTIVEQITKNLSREYECTTLDGVRVNFDPHSWGAVRCSNTSPNLTLRFEAPNETRLKEIVERMLKELKKYPAIDLWWANRFK